MTKEQQKRVKRIQSDMGNKITDSEMVVDIILDLIEELYPIYNLRKVIYTENEGCFVNEVTYCPHLRRRIASKDGETLAKIMKRMEKIDGKTLKTVLKENKEFCKLGFEFEITSIDPLVVEMTV